MAILPLVAQERGTRLAPPMGARTTPHRWRGIRQRERARMTSPRAKAPLAARKPEQQKRAAVARARTSPKVVTALPSSASPMYRVATTAIVSPYPGMRATIRCPSRGASYCNVASKGQVAKTMTFATQTSCASMRPARRTAIEDERNRDVHSTTRIRKGLALSATVRLWVHPPYDGHRCVVSRERRWVGSQNQLLPPWW